MGRTGPCERAGAALLSPLGGDVLETPGEHKENQVDRTDSPTRLLGLSGVGKGPCANNHGDELFIFSCGS